jgi:hypothetical protein
MYGASFEETGSLFALAQDGLAINTTVLSSGTPIDNTSPTFGGPLPLQLLNSSATIITASVGDTLGVVNVASGTAHLSSDITNTAINAYMVVKQLP